VGAGADIGIDGKFDIAVVAIRACRAIPSVALGVLWAAATGGIAAAGMGAGDIGGV